ncbi:hypothetical protein FUA48_01410 [Flavobacterium alkalisoli]|uniref:Peptidase E n=1 Tax=Flavobacterium alkalisoli TaxID=2602769 RepID=A0A5B9FN16_9FLAO|nr:DUF6702 family protein [Flavobacterium alkalisoli]QEE48280.1 hypothetical protein FUA48_01410 [Flavobacterium alkalisoli]
MLAAVLTSAAVHKYYVAVFMMEQVPEKKELQITARIFIDDLDKVLSDKNKKQFFLCTKKEVADADKYINQYVTEKLQVKVNGTVKPLKILGRETEDDILILYITAEAKGKIKTLEVRNTMLFDAYPEQQNIINTKIDGNKKSLLLTNDNPQDILHY